MRGLVSSATDRVVNLSIATRLNDDYLKIESITSSWRISSLISLTNRRWHYKPDSSWETYLFNGSRQQFFVGYSFFVFRRTSSSNYVDIYKIWTRLGNFVIRRSNNLRFLLTFEFWEFKKLQIRLLKLRDDPITYKIFGNYHTYKQRQHNMYKKTLKYCKNRVNGSRQEYDLNTSKSV